MALNSGIYTYQILRNDDEVCIPSLSSIQLAVFRPVEGPLKKWLEHSKGELAFVFSINNVFLDHCESI